MQKIDRRKALTVVAAAPAAVAIGALPAFTFNEPGRLAALVKRYFKELDAFNAGPLDDDDEYFLADQPFDATLTELVGLPARGAEDALAAVKWIIDLGRGGEVEFGGETLYGQVADSLISAVRDYLTEGVRP